MFKGEGRVWLYLLGVIIMFGILVTVSREVWVPFVYREENIDLNPDEFGTPPSFSIDLNQDYLAEIDTNLGKFTIDLYEDSAPENVNNIAYLANGGYYTNTTFHRVIKNFLLQAGDRNTLDADPKNDGKGNPGYFVEDEINWDSLDFSDKKRAELTKLGYISKPGVESQPLERLSVAMANSGPDTNGSQFFIITARFDDPRLIALEGKYTVVGKIISGHDTIEKMTAVETEEKDNIERPKQEIKIFKFDIITR